MKKALLQFLKFCVSVTKVRKLQRPEYKPNTLAHFLTAGLVNSTRILANILKEMSQRMQEI